MSNESKNKYIKKEQEELLLEFYKEILSATDSPSLNYQKKFLLQLLNTKISQIESKANRTKFLHYFLRITVMVFSGVTTVLLGLKFGKNIDTTKIYNIALIISACITFLSGLAVFWDIENYWIRIKIMLNKFKEIRYEYVFFLTGNTEPKTKDLKFFLDKFLINLGDEYWEKFLKDVKGQPDKD